MKKDIVQNLNEGWKFKEKSTENWHQASIPGFVHLDLFDNEQIPDPFYRTNEKDLQWIHNKDWIYKLLFTPDKKLFNKNKIELKFFGLDTYAAVLLNGKKILEADNMFHPWSIDVSNILTSNENKLEIIFRSPIKEVLPILKEMDYVLPADNDQIKKTSPHTRKAPYHYGWDWGPSFATSGIWQPVQLIGRGDFSINKSHFKQESLSNNLAVIDLHLEIESFIDVSTELLITQDELKIEKKIKTDLSKGTNNFIYKIKVEDPILWWPAGHGEQKLYNFEIIIKSKNLQERVIKKVGFRDILVKRDKDDKGESFYFSVNGKPIFAKGANWIPADSFTTRIEREKYLELLTSAVDANMNMIRVWGGGIYESDHFYEICDELGILVWQDFMFACTMYPGDKPFLESVEKEATYQVERIREHPCLAIWCGNNEISWAWHDWDWKNKYPEKIYSVDYKKLFHELLPSICERLDPSTFYWPSSPGWSQELPPKGQKYGSGDNHFWDVWHGGKEFSEYNKNVGRFMSEYGMQSFPDLKTIDLFTSEDDRNIDSDVVQSHQKASLGNANVIKYVDMYFDKSKDFSAFVLLTQIMAGEAIRVAVESHRKQMPYCMGSLYWQLNDCWPGASWSSLDYYGSWKALHYYAREFFKPAIIIISEERENISIYISNDDKERNNLVLSISLIAFSGKVLKKYEKKIILLKIGSNEIFKKPKQFFGISGNENTSLLRCEVLYKKDVISQRDYIFSKPKNLVLPKSNFEYHYKIIDGEYYLFIEAKSFLFKLIIQCLNDRGVFSQNYFEMIKGQIAKIQYTPSKKYFNENLEKKLEFDIKTLFDLNI